MKFKIGTPVRCIPGYITGDRISHGNLAGGVGYKSGKIFVIAKITGEDSMMPVAWQSWPATASGGVFLQALELYFIDPLERECDKIKTEIGLSSSQEDIHFYY